MTTGLIGYTHLREINDTEAPPGLMSSATDASLEMLADWLIRPLARWVHSGPSSFDMVSDGSAEQNAAAISG
jgi:hypothetical protein